MRLNVLENAKRNIIFGFLNKAIVLICPFITRTVIQYILGKEYLGLSSLFTSILSVLSLAELGFGSAIVFSMYKPVAEGDVQLVNALLKFYRRVYITIGIVVFLIGVTLLPFLKHLIKGEYPREVNIYLLFLIYIINTVIGYFLYGYLTSILVVYQREDINSRTNLIITIMLTITQIVLLCKYKSYFLFIAIMPLFTVVNNLRIAYVVRKNYPQYRCSGELPKYIFCDLKKQVAGTFVSKICIVARNSFDSICISAFIGLTKTGIYDNYYLIISAIGSVLGVIASSFNGGIGNHVVTRSVDDNFTELKKLDFVYMWISGWCTVCLLCLYQPFMLLWMGKEMLLPNQAIILLCIYFYLLRVGDMRSIYVLVKGLWWHQRYRSIFEAVCNIILNIILAKFFGIYGIIIATIITLLFIHTIWSSWIVFTNYFEQRHMMEYFKYQLKYTLGTILVAILTYFICKLYYSENMLFVLIVRFVICVVFSNFIYFIIYKNSQELRSVRQILFKKYK